MKHKKLKYVEVKTHPNGYSLTTGDKEYMYLDLRQLIEGIFVHVGLGEGEYMTREKVADLLAVCEEWIEKRDQVFDHAKASAEIKRLNRLLKQKQNTIETLQLTLETMQDKLDSVPRSQARRKDAPASKNKNFTRADAGLPPVPKKRGYEEVQSDH
jgi:uncharacterized coiled-coil protein SlyX